MAAVDVPTLSEAQRISARRLLRIPYCPHTPTPKQAAFLLDLGREALYGGAAAGGKSDALLMAALQFIEVPNYSAILFRRSFTDLELPGALMDRAADWMSEAGLTRSGGVRWNNMVHSWEFPWGSKLSFGYIKNRSDRDRYRSAEFQYVGFDELTQFPEEKDYRFLFSRTRKPALATGHPLAYVPVRVRAATNPGGDGHPWVRRRFIEPWLAWDKRGRQSKRPSRTYHPATLDDLREFVNTDEYELMLDELDSVTYAQMRHGDWDIRPAGRIFDRTWFKTMPHSSIPNDMTWVRYWDLAATDPDPDKDPDYTVGALLGRSAKFGIFILADIERFQSSPGGVEARIAKVAEHDGRDIPVRMEQEPGASGKIVIAHFRKLLAGWDFGGAPSSGSKIERAKPFAAQADPARGRESNVRLVEGVWVEEFLDECEMFPDGGDGAHDDQVDAVSGAFGYLTGRGEFNGLRLSGLEQRNRWNLS